MSIEQEQVFEIWFNWGSLSFLKSKNIVSIYKGSTKINLLLAYHFLYKNNKKNIESHHRFKNIIQVLMCLFWRQRGVQLAKLEGISSAANTAWERRTADIELTLGFYYSGYRRYCHAIQRRWLSSHRPFLLLFYCASRHSFLKTQFLGCWVFHSPLSAPLVDVVAGWVVL